MSGSLTLASGEASVFPVGFGYYPPEGSRVISSQYSWLTQNTYIEDLSFALARGVETSIQAMFIDNSQNSLPVTVYVFATQHSVVIQGYSQAFMPVFFTGAPMFQISTQNINAGYTRLQFLNVAAQTASVWSSQNNSTTAGSSLLNIVNPGVVIKTGHGNVYNMSCIVDLVSSGGVPFGLYDAATIGAAANANCIWQSLTTVTAGTTVNFRGVPFATGLVAKIANVGAMSVFYS